MSVCVYVCDYEYICLFSTWKDLKRLYDLIRQQREHYTIQSITSCLVIQGVVSSVKVLYLYECELWQCADVTYTVFQLIFNWLSRTGLKA